MSIATPVNLTIAAIILLLLAEPASAFRCGNKLVKEDMHEEQVLAICGEPASIRHLGYTLRTYSVPYRGRYRGTYRLYGNPGHGVYSQEVVVTEYVYNFGPRRKMRRLLFEGGILVSIEDIGYGYHKKKR